MTSGLLKGVIVVAIGLLCISHVSHASVSGYYSKVSWDTQIFNSLGTTTDYLLPAIGDVNGDGFKEILVESYQHVFCCSMNGEILWRVYNNAHTTPMLVDVNNDSIYEIIINYGSGVIACLNGSSGTSMWTTSSLSIPKDAYAAGDVDSDERVEIIIVDVASPGIVALNGADGSTRWTRGITGGISGSPFVTDLADDGTVEVLVGTTTGSILSLSGYDGTIQWTTTINTVAVKIKAIGDVDEDTYPDIVCTSSSQLYVISGASHSIMWTSSFTITSGYDTEVAISDVNNDGIAELIIHDSALLRVVNARTGITSWSANVNSQPGLQIADINTDGLGEIFICASTRYLESISGDGLVTTVFPFEGHGSTITDLNNDGNLELIFGYLEIYGRAGGYLYSHLKCRDLLEYATSVNFYGQPGPWPCVRGSTLRTNAYLDTDHDNLSNDLERCIGTSLTLYDTDLDILTAVYL